MLNTGDLRAHAFRFRDLYLEDPLHFFPPWIRDVDPANLAGLPLIYLGGGTDHARWLYLRHEGTYGFDRIAIAEPYRPVRRIMGQKTLSAQGLLKLVKSLREEGREFLCIDFCMEEGDYRRHRHYAATRTFRMLDWAEAFRLPVFENLQTGPINDLVTGLPEIMDRAPEIEASLADELSKMTLYRILLFRLTLQREYLWPVAVSMASEYFYSGFFEIGDDEVFLDLGAFDGDTLRTFVAATRGRFRKYYGFEPSPANFDRLVATRDWLRLGDAAVLERKAVSAAAGEVTFAPQWGMGSRIVAEDDVGVRQVTKLPKLPGLLRLVLRPRRKPSFTVVPAVSLDEYFQGGDPVTFLKLDVEGAEMAALEGARQFLAKNRPKLAISAYHLPTDLIEICRFIIELDVGYTIGLRHHNTSHWDSVLYAWT